MAFQDEAQHQGSPTMASSSMPTNSFFGGAMISPKIITSPHSPASLPVSSPELLSETEFPHPLHLDSGRSTSTPLPPSSDASIPSPNLSPARTTHLTFVDSRPDLTSPSGSRSRSSSLRYAFPPTHSSTTPPRSPLLDGVVSPRTVMPPPAESPSVLTKSSKGRMPGSLSRTRSPGSGPIAAIRRNSQDRRVRSEGLGPRPSPMAHGKSASLVTGGYVTSDSDSLSDEGGIENGDGRPGSSRAASSFFSSRPTHLVVQERRKRAQSLMLPAATGSDHSPSGDGSGSVRSIASGRNNKRRPPDLAIADMKHHQRERSNSISTSRPTALPRASHLRANGHSSPRSPLSSNPPSRLPSTYFPPAESSSSRHASFRVTDNGHGRASSSRSPPKRTEDLPARSREVDRLRREEGVSSPEGTRKGKEKAVELPIKRHALAASLAYSSRSRDTAVLTDEQIQDLFSHSEIGKVARLSQGSPGSTLIPVKHDRRLSTSMDSRPPAPQHRELYTVTAPPALIRDEDGHLRDRTLSVSSSIAPSPRRASQKARQASLDEDEQETEPARRRREAARRRSSTVVEPEGGHIPFTHHLPTRLNEVHEGSSGEDASAHTTFDDDRPTSSALLEAPSTSLGTASPGKTSDKKRKGRLSGLFRRSKKSFENLRNDVSPHQVAALHHEQVRADHAKAREKWEKDNIVQELERERRDAELAEERKYQAFLEVQAHPAAATRASQVGSHLWAWYSQIYETIDDPPKLNPLAVLRYKRKTAEQDEARERYKAEQAELEKQPTSFPSVWTHQGYLSSSSLGGRTKPRSTGVSTKGARSSTSIKSGAFNHVMAPGWHYTIDDVSAYRATGGRVQYHMPQRAIEVSAARSGEPSHSDQINRSKVAGDDFHPQNGGQEVDLSSSIGSGGKSLINQDIVERKAFHGNLRSTSMLSVNGPMANSPSSSQIDLARTSSIETGPMKRSPSTRRFGRQSRQHPSHQSLSAINPLAHPIDSLKHWKGGKRQHTLPHSGTTTPIGVDSGIDEPGREKRSIRHYESPLRSTPQSNLLTTVRNRTTPVHTTPLRAHDTRAVSEDEDHHRSGRRGKPAGILVVRPGKAALSPRNSPSRGDLKDLNRETERLLAVREDEMQFELRTGGDHGRTERRKEVEAQLDSHELRVYRERQTFLMASRERMTGFTSTTAYAEDFVRVQLAQIEQLKNYASISAEVEVEFPGLEGIRARHSELRRRSTALNGDAAWDGQPPSRRASRKTSVYGSSILPPTLPLSTKPWPRRAVLDRQGARIDPLTQVEVALQDAEQAEDGMQRSKEIARAGLQDMSQSIVNLHDAKNRVRDELETRVEELKKMRDHIINTERRLAARSSWWSIESSRETDKWIDMLIRHPVSAIVRLLNLLFELPFLPFKSGKNFMCTLGLLAGIVGLIMALP